MESTLATQYNDLAGEVGIFAGWGRGVALGDAAWDAKQQAFIDSCVKSGLRQFYYPPVLDGQKYAYEWSFLRPVTNLVLAANSSVIPLPEDFGSPEGPLTVLGTSQISGMVNVPLVGEGVIRGQFQTTPNRSGRPLFAALQPLRGTSPTAGQRFQLVVYPTADQAYTFQMAYNLNPDYLNAAAPYAYGGAQHAETIIASCLAVAEERLDDAQGVRWSRFLERLAASISLDQRNKPELVGYNGDGSDGVYSPTRGQVHGFTLVTIYGVSR